MVGDAVVSLRMQVTIPAVLGRAGIEIGNHRLPFRRAEGDVAIVEQQGAAKALPLGEQNARAGTAGIPAIVSEVLERLEQDGFTRLRLR
ncbi:MAG: hypothetical protein DMG65_06620 [Candidatus Angelobacter sp. Gp1-AA117]|nr:MAG: hypothetical protein DMG65_06620 [Candidatus Angelobacter sp. Gp1-AA117]